MKTPESAHKQTGVLKRRWKTYYKTSQNAVAH
jgi:hypothetical protein